MDGCVERSVRARRDHRRPPGLARRLADAPREPVHKPYIKYDRLEDVGQRILAEKSKLRDIIDRHGGVSAVAQKSGIPQPSLSRMLSSASIPRRSTLYKIANALGLSEEDIVMEWSC